MSGPAAIEKKTKVDWQASRGGAILGAIAIPGDKSISHRAAILAAIATGQSRIRGFLQAEDTLATQAALAALSARFETREGDLLVNGVGLRGLQAPRQTLDLGNSGTGLRLLAGLLAGQSFDSRLTGDDSLRRRPMQRILQPLRRMGARIAAQDDGFAPLQISGMPLAGIAYEPPVASAQVKSCLLLAGLMARGETRIEERVPTRDHTERLLAQFGVRAKTAHGVVSVQGGASPIAAEVAIPGDFSSAAFFIVAACLVRGSKLTIHDVGVNPRRTGLLHALNAMGARIALRNPRLLGNEEIADIEIEYAALRGSVLPQALVADMIDELPVFAVAAAFAQGRTEISGARELRTKESDRIATMARALTKLGVPIEERDDGLLIEGGGAVPGGVEVDSAGDHRVAMALAVAGQLTDRPIRIADCAPVRTSFPDFIGSAQQIGFAAEEIRQGSSD